MAGKSTTSNETENLDNSDSLPDSEALDAIADDTSENDDAPVVIEGEAKEISNDAEQDAEIAQTDDQAEHSDNVLAADDTPNSVEETQTEPAQVAAAPEKRGSVVPLVFGGLVAGAIGYGASHFGVLDADQTATVAETSVVNTSALDTRLAELGSEIGTLSSGLDALASDVAGMTPADTAPLTERVETLTADLEALRNTPAESGEMPSDMVARFETLEADFANGMSGLTDRIEGLEDRLADMQMAQEADPTGNMAEDELAAFQSQLETLAANATAQVEEAKARASAFEQEAAKAAAMAERQAALAALTSAVESGGSFSNELGFFKETPDALTAIAENGVPTLSALQREFPDAARAALATATVVPQDASAGDRLTAFLKRQTNARSLKPKEGDGTDAVLSRAEASVAQGDLEGSLAELSSLSDETKDVLGPWMTNAQARLDALSALSELTAAVN